MASYLCRTELVSLQRPFPPKPSMLQVDCRLPPKFETSSLHRSKQTKAPGTSPFRKKTPFLVDQLTPRGAHHLKTLSGQSYTTLLSRLDIYRVSVAGRATFCAICSRLAKQPPIYGEDNGLQVSGTPAICRCAVRQELQIGGYSAKRL